MTRFRRDIDDLDDNLFDREEAQRRHQQRAAEKADWMERGAELQKQEAARLAAVETRVKGFRQRNNARMIEREYEAAGVSPPNRAADGAPEFSLALLLRTGWRIETLQNGEKQLVAPPTREPWTGHRDRDSLPEH